jgi:glutamyl/glutaminyl-tRNA synthetase
MSSTQRAQRAYRGCADNFQKLYECAVELIRRNLAYVCHQQADEVGKRR